MHTHERPDWSNTELVADALWSHHIYGQYGALSDSVYEAMAAALAAVAAADPARAATVFGTLRADRHEAAAFLLARGYSGNPAVFADEAAGWLAATPDARLLGYADSTRVGLPAARRRHHPPLLTTPGSTSSSTSCCTTPRRYERTHRGLRAAASPSCACSTASTPPTDPNASTGDSPSCAASSTATTSPRPRASPAAPCRRRSPRTAPGG